MDCSKTRERLSDFLDGSLSGTVGKEISRHLGECPGCAEVARSLDAVREGLRNLPPVPAPPELLGRIREAVAAEGGAAGGSAGGTAATTPTSPDSAPGRRTRTVFSRLKVPLQTAAAVLLVASAYRYWAESPTATIDRTAATALPPAEIASPVPAPEAPAPPAVSPAPVQVARETRLPAVTPRAAAPPPTERANESVDHDEERSISSLPEDTPDPKVRVYSLSDLPSSPVLRASTRFRRIQPAQAPEESPSAEATEPSTEAARTARLRPPFPYGRDVSLETDPEDREEAAERIRETARRLGGTVEGTDRVASEGTVAVRVLLPERTAQAFIDELGRIGAIPPGGMPTRSVLPAGPTPGTIAYTVRLRTR